MEKTTFLIRDEKGMVYKEVAEPTAVFDMDTGTLLQLGDYEEMKDYFTFTQDTYRKAGYHNMADSIFLMELPKKQEIVDMVLHSSGYVKTLYEQSIAH